MQMITKDDILKGMNDGIIGIFYHYGITCMVGNYSFYFDGFDGDDYDCVEDFLEDYTKEEIAELVADTISDSETAWENGIEKDEWDYMYNFLHRADNIESWDWKFITLTLSNKELKILEDCLFDMLDIIEKHNGQDTDTYKEIVNFCESLVRIK